MIKNVICIIIATLFNLTTAYALEAYTPCEEAQGGLLLCPSLYRLGTWH